MIRDALIDTAVALALFAGLMWVGELARVIP